MDKAEISETVTKLSLRALRVLEDILSRTDPAAANEIMALIHGAGRVFVTGSGRSMLMMRGFAMRLMQLGHEAFVAGDTCTPGIAEGDLLLAGTASGKTPIVVSHLSKAKQVGAKTVIFTAVDVSPAAELSDAVAVIPGTSVKAGFADDENPAHITGSSFEEALLIYCDALALTYARTYGLDSTPEGIMSRHANLE